MEAASDAAAAFVNEGRADSARRAAARARELHVPDQGTELPAIDGLDAAAVELTPREAQLIGLATQGLSNAEIADRLVISVRTVETHLYRGMQKLGISDRRELSAPQLAADAATGSRSTGASSRGCARHTRRRAIASITAAPVQ